MDRRLALSLRHGQIDFKLIGINSWNGFALFGDGHSRKAIRISVGNGGVSKVEWGSVDDSGWEQTSLEVHDMFAISLVFLLAAHAHAAPPDCRPIEGVGCYRPPAGKPGDAPPILVYLRGWFGRWEGRVPPEHRAASAQDAVRFYALAEAAEAIGAGLLVTGSADVGVTDEILDQLEAQERTRFGRLFLASHSGGYVGLSRTLGRLRRPDRIVMLDNFYFQEELALAVQQQVAAGAVCVGYFTPHNRERYEARFRPFAYCPVQALSGQEHNRGVNRCLGRLLNSLRCD